jgi:hypothetical protein
LESVTSQYFPKISWLACERKVLLEQAKSKSKSKYEMTISNSHYETDFGVSSALGAGNTKICFLKASQRRAFKKPIFIIRIAG